MEKIHSLRVRGDVDDLRQVDDDDPPVVVEQIVGREIAVREAGAGERLEDRDDLGVGIRQFIAAMAGLRDARCGGAAVRPSPMNSISTSVSLTCTG